MKKKAGKGHRKARRRFLFTKKIHITTLPYLSSFEDGYIVTVYDPSVDVARMLDGFAFDLWTYTKRSILVDQALASHTLSNSPNRFVRFALRDDGTAVMDCPIPVAEANQATFKAANQLLQERVKDCIKAGFTELEVISLPSRWLKDAW